MPFGTGTIGNIGGAVADLYAADADRMRGRGQRKEAESYDIAADLSIENRKFAESSNIIKTAQLDRQIMKTEATQQADVAASGFTQGGSALDIMRSSASQGALTRAVLQQQGAITDLGYKEQEESYRKMAEVSRMSADAMDKAAQGADISAGFKFASAVASVFELPGGGFGMPGGGG